MIAHRIWAFIKDNEVKNTVICENYPLANQLAKNTLGTEAFAVEVSQIPTGIGDTYEDGMFKDKEGSVIAPLPTAEEELNMLKAENEEFKVRIQTTQDAVDFLIMGGMM